MAGTKNLKLAQHAYLKQLIHAWHSRVSVLMLLRSSLAGSCCSSWSFERSHGLFADIQWWAHFLLELLIGV